jgi:hypothetical protein
MRMQGLAPAATAASAAGCERSASSSASSSSSSSSSSSASRAAAAAAAEECRPILVQIFKRLLVTDRLTQSRARNGNKGVEATIIHHFNTYTIITAKATPFDGNNPSRLFRKKNNFKHMSAL